MSILQFAKNNTSQNGENGILDECIKRIKPKLKVAVEFGAPTMEYCSNIFPLPHFWKKHFYDSNPQDPKINKLFVTTENINSLPACTVMSIDCDGPDYELWSAYTGAPDIVIIEINSSLNPDIDHYRSDYGCNFSKMNKLAEAKNYFLLCHTGNCIYIHNKHRNLFPDADQTFNRSWLF